MNKIPSILKAFADVADAQKDKSKYTECRRCNQLKPIVMFGYCKECISELQKLRK